MPRARADLTLDPQAPLPVLLYATAARRSLGGWELAGRTCAGGGAASE